MLLEALMEFVSGKKNKHLTPSDRKYQSSHKINNRRNTDM